MVQKEPIQGIDDLVVFMVYNEFKPQNSPGLNLKYSIQFRIKEYKVLEVSHTFFK